MDADEQIPIKYVARELVDGGFTDTGPDYARIYRACLSARIPAEQDTNGRWSIRRRHLPAAASALRLTPPGASSQPRRERRAVGAAA